MFKPENVLKRYDLEEQVALLDELLARAAPKQDTPAKLVHLAETVEAAEQLRAERAAQERTLDAHECVEGVRAFFEKRDPDFSAH